MIINKNWNPFSHIQLNHSVDLNYQNQTIPVYFPPYYRLWDNIHKMFSVHLCVFILMLNANTLGKKTARKQYQNHRISIP